MTLQLHELVEYAGIDAADMRYSQRIGQVEIRQPGICSIRETQTGCLCYTNTVTPDVVSVCKGILLIDSKNLAEFEDQGICQDKDVIVCDNPRTIFIVLVAALDRIGFFPEYDWGTESTGICHVQDGVEIHPTAIIEPGCCIYAGTKIGAGTVVSANTVIGAAGTNLCTYKGKRYRMPQIGGVTIGDNCFIGSNVTIARGATDDTFISNDVNIAHGTQIGHDVSIHKNAFIANGVSIAGHASIGPGCYIGAGTAIRNRVSIGASVKVGCGASVVRSYEHLSLESPLVLVGVPAKPIERNHG